MKCLCCGKEIINAKEIEMNSRWHNKCVKKFFEVNVLPQIDLSEDILKDLAIKSSQLGYTIPGVQKKLSLHLTKEHTSRLTLLGYPIGYILKPQTDEYPQLPENEYMIMQMANFVGIKTVPFALIDIGKNSLAYITKRIDRNGEKKFAMEDFCQLDQRLTSDKYKGSYERCSKVIEKYSLYKTADLTELYIRVVFSFLVGNSDMHLKNFSLISFDDEKYSLSPAYDMLSVKIVLNDLDDMALTLNDKNRNLQKNDFFKFGETIGLKIEICKKIIGRLLSQVDDLISICRESYLSDDLKEKFISLIKDRTNRLSE